MRPNNIIPINILSDKLSSDLEQFKSEAFQKQLHELFRFKKAPRSFAKLILFALGAVFTFISFAGLMLGYVRGYNRFMRPKYELPRLNNLPLIVKCAMFLGVILVWSVIFVLIMFWFVVKDIDPIAPNFITAFLAINLVISYYVFAVFNSWRVSVWNLLSETNKDGSARYATADDFRDYTHNQGLFIGGNYSMNDKGHCLTVAGARGGKSRNLLMANILNRNNCKSSMVYIDVKGEAAAVSANYLRRMGKRVIIINPWDLLPDNISGRDTYNPLSILSDKKSKHLIDDVSLIAELLVPSVANDHNAFFTDSARNLVAGLLLHLVTHEDVKNPTLCHLWEWIRYSGEAWDNLLADMAVCKDPINGLAVRMAASEIAKQLGSPETFASIISHSLEATSFLKSLALQQSLVSGGLDPYSINDGNTVVFIVIPFDKLKSHSAYLRVVVTSLLRAVVRKPSHNKVTFICDEAFNLGKISEFETALSGYAGFNITMWLVYQDLSQIASTYGDNWQSIVGNCTIRQFMSIKDVFSLEYISKLMGDTTRVMFTKNKFGTIKSVESNARPLKTPNEVMRLSENHIILFAGEKPVTVLPKVAYYDMPEFRDENGNRLYDLNPYVENSK